MKKILLVQPVPTRFELTQHEAFLKLPFVKTKGFCVPLPIAAVAALTPDDFEVNLWDEHVHGKIDGSDVLKNYDLVGVTGYVGHLPRANEIAEICRREGIRVVIGGPGVSKQPHLCQDAFDHLFLGEVELTWPQFLADWKEGKPQRVYRQVVGVDLALSPPPRWDSLADQVQYYRSGALQTSRGCPFDCAFCDVSLLFGARYRTKPIDNVLQEVANLEKLGFTIVIFCDDNFIGSHRYAKELLRELIPLNNSFRRPLRFATEMSIDMARDEELLELLADASFAEIAVGIESPNKESLKEAQKYQNYRTNLVEDVQKVQSYGIPIRGSLIVGFDHDGKDIFDQHFQFLQDSCLTVPDFRIMMAAPGSKFWRRLLTEGRLLKSDSEGRFFGDAATTNIIPKNMTRTELQTGVWNLKERLYDWEAFAVRAKGFVSNVKRRPKVPKRGREWKLLFHFTGFLFSSLIDWKTRRVILDILWYTRKKEPSMLPPMARMILRQFAYANTLELRDAAQKQIDPEQSGTVKLETEQSETLVPEGFRVPYEEIFPEVNKEVYEGLKDKTRSGETLIEIFTKVLRYWRSTRESFSAEHRSYLMELTRRTVAEKNGPSENRVSGFSFSTTNIIDPDLKKAPLPDDILRAVEQELLMEGSEGVS